MSHQPLPFYSKGSESILRVKGVLYRRCLSFCLNGTFKETGWFKNEHAILLQVQCIHTASLFWHTHQAQPHPTHQLSSHVKFTQGADRQTHNPVCCVHFSVCVCVCVRDVGLVCVRAGKDGSVNITHRAARAKSILETRSPVSVGGEPAPEPGRSSRLCSRWFQQ